MNLASLTAKQPIDGIALSNALRPALVGMAVRRLMFEALSEEEKVALAAVIDKLLARSDYAPMQ